MRPMRQVSEPRVTNPPVLRAEVNDPVVQGTFMFLSGEICFTRDRKVTSKTLVYRCLGSPEFIDWRERNRWKPLVPLWVTMMVIKQKPADGIVAKRLS